MRTGMDIGRHILERAVTSHSTLAQQSYRSEAAVLVIVNKLGQVLLAQENEADVEFGRKSGQWNLITETWRAGQSTKGNFISAMEEELGRVETLKSMMKLIRGSYREANFGPETKNPSRAHLAIFRFLGNPKELPFRPVNTQEILGYRWAPPNIVDKLHREDLLAPSVYEYMQQLQKENLLQPYTGHEFHDELRERPQGSIGDDVLRMQ